MNLRIRYSANRLRRALRRHGVLDTGRKAMRYVWRRVILRPVADRLFDWKWRVNTAGIIPPDKDRDRIRKSSNAYEGTLPWVFRRALSSVPADFARLVFIDVGCGKGRTLLMASEHRFKDIIGVELEPELAEIARQNVIRSGRSGERISVVCANAAEYEYPEDNLLVYLSNPFQEEVMAATIHNLRAAAVRKDRELYVLYHQPVLAHLFDACGFLHAVAREPDHVVYTTAAKASSMASVTKGAAIN